MSLSDLYDRIRRMLRDVGLSHLARELKDMTAAHNGQRGGDRA